MDEIHLARLFIQYAEKRNELEFLQHEIESAVLEIGETQSIAGVTAKYFKPSTETPDYKSTAINAKPTQEVIDGFSTKTETVTVKWKEVCAHLGLDVPPGAEKPARVVIV